MKKQPLFWKVCIGVIVLLCVLSFTPLVIPAGVADPAFLGMPRTLWAGLLIYGVIVAVTYISTLVHPDRSENQGDME